MNSAKNIDMTAMREKYAQERDRRLARKPDERQYRDIDQGFSHLLDDPYGVAPPRDARSRRGVPNPAARSARA